MYDWISDASLAAIVGLIGGVLLGLAARLGRFCTLGAIEDALYAHSGLRMRMWGVAIGVAMIGSHVLIATGHLPAAEATYLRIGWNPMASIIGGLLFGYGMALSGNCGFGALARLGWWRPSVVRYRTGDGVVGLCGHLRPPVWPACRDLS